MKCRLPILGLALLLLMSASHAQASPVTVSWSLAANQTGAVDFVDVEADIVCFITYPLSAGLTSDVGLDIYKGPRGTLTSAAPSAVLDKYHVGRYSPNSSVVISCLSSEVIYISRSDAAKVPLTGTVTLWPLADFEQHSKHAEVANVLAGIKHAVPAKPSTKKPNVPGLTEYKGVVDFFDADSQTPKELFFGITPQGQGQMIFAFDPTIESTTTLFASVVFSASSHQPIRVFADEHNNVKRIIYGK